MTREYTSTNELFGNLVSAYGSGSTSYFEYDGLGSTDALLTDAEFAQDRYSYRAFGLATHTGTSSGGGAMLPSQLPFMLGSVGSGGTSAGSDFNFVGRLGYMQDSEIDLYFVRARHYDPVAGRWVSEDPKGYEADENLYRYVFNNPVNGVDPSGKDLLAYGTE